MISAIITGARVAWSARHIKGLISEVRDVIVGINALSASYKQAQADGKITPAEGRAPRGPGGGTGARGHGTKAKLEKFF
jgi:hypothetical protein